MEIKCQIDETEVFIADLIACSTCFGHHYAHHQELKSIIQWLLPVVFRAAVFKLLAWYGAEGYVPGLQDAQPPRHSTHLVTNLDNTRHLRLRTQIPQKLTKLLFTFLQHKIPQAATIE